MVGPWRVNATCDRYFCCSPEHETIDSTEQITLSFNFEVRICWVWILALILVTGRFYTFLHYSGLHLEYKNDIATHLIECFLRIEEENKHKILSIEFSSEGMKSYERLEKTGSDAAPSTHIRTIGGEERVCGSKAHIQSVSSTQGENPIPWAHLGYLRFKILYQSKHFILVPTE